MGKRTSRNLKDNSIDAVFLAVVILLVIVPVFASCKNSGNDTGFVNDVVENILIAMNNGDYENFSKDFDDNIKAELSED